VRCLRHLKSGAKRGWRQVVFRFILIGSRLARNRLFGDELWYEFRVGFLCRLVSTGKEVGLPVPIRFVMAWTLVCWGVSADVAAAQTLGAGRNWAIDFETSLQATDNVQQQAGGTSDLIARNSLELSYFPAADADNSALFRLQALQSRFQFNNAFNSIFIVGTGLASRRLIHNSFGYGGYQFIHKQAEQQALAARQDSDLFGGAVTYHPLGANRLIYHGYQMDFLRAGIAETSYQGHSLYLNWRDASWPRFSYGAGARSQLRLYDQIGALEWRNQLTLDARYRLTDWISIQAELIHINATASVPALTFNTWMGGVFSRFHW
jgi:hypothetical protein